MEERRWTDEQEDEFAEGGMDRVRRMGEDGRWDGRRNVTDGSCLARAGRERRGWHHRVREHTLTHTDTHNGPCVHSALAQYTRCCQECFRCLPLCQENVGAYDK